MTLLVLFRIVFHVKSKSLCTFSFLAWKIQANDKCKNFGLFSFLLPAPSLISRAFFLILLRQSIVIVIMIVIVSTLFTGTRNNQYSLGYLVPGCYSSFNVLTNHVQINVFIEIVMKYIISYHIISHWLYHIWQIFH